MTKVANVGRRDTRAEAVRARRAELTVKAEALLEHQENVAALGVAYRRRLRQEEIQHEERLARLKAEIGLAEKRLVAVEAKEAYVLAGIKNIFDELDAAIAAIEADRKMK